MGGLAFLLKPASECRSQTGIPQLLGVKKLPPLVSVVILLWLAAIVGGTELWYASNEKRREHTTLEVVWPTTLPGYKELAVPEIVRQVLLSSSGRMAVWRDGCQWSLATFRWHAGRTAPQSARVHRPDTCLQASGAVLERELEPVTIASGRANLRFKSYLFSLNGQPLFVFFTIWEEANLDAKSRAVSQDWSGWSRVQRAFAGSGTLASRVWNSFFPARRIMPRQWGCSRVVYPNSFGAATLNEPHARGRKSNSDETFCRTPLNRWQKAAR